MKGRLTVVLVGLLALPILGCTRNISRDDLIGTYRIHQKYGVETLVLSPDGSFLQEIAPPVGEVVRNVGTWDAPGPLPKRLVVLHGALLVDDFDPNWSLEKRKVGTWEIPAYDYRFGVKLYPDPDTDEVFEKIGPSPSP
jgi:hypothetical protein